MDAPVFARFSETAKYCFFTEKCIIFKWRLLSPELTISVKNGFQSNIERLEIVPQTHFIFLIYGNKAEINLNFGWNFENAFAFFDPRASGTVY